MIEERGEGGEGRGRGEGAVRGAGDISFGNDTEPLLQESFRERNNITPIGDILIDFQEGRQASIRGRIVEQRSHGHVVFLDLQEESGRLQLRFQAPETGSLDFGLGDIVEVCGTTYMSSRGSPSLDVVNISVIAGCRDPQGIGELMKAARHRSDVPRKSPGCVLADRERFEFAAACSRAGFAARAFLHGEGFLEFDTSVLQPKFDAGLARPWESRSSHGDAFFLRLTSELRLKELLGLGYERVFELGKSFRNEDMGRLFLPEFTLLEVGRAFAVCTDMMALFERMTASVVSDVAGSSRLPVHGDPACVMDFGAPWKRVSFDEAVRKFSTLEISTDMPPERIHSLLLQKGFIAEGDLFHQAIKRIVRNIIVPNIRVPTFIVGLPRDLSPFTKPDEENPNLSQRAIPAVDGLSLGDIYTDINDPVELRASLKRQADEVSRRHGASKDINEDFLRLMELGMPPSASLGVSFNRFLLIFRPKGIPRDVRETILFPPR